MPSWTEGVSRRFQISFPVPRVERERRAHGHAVEPPIADRNPVRLVDGFRGE